ncbi:MAG: Tetratricopeptide protein [Chlorobi bacterium]|nr:Tetratricopeptide protein [Chlorobiota bacterium]
MRTTLVALSAATLFLALSGFDCASTEMTTAKLAIRNRDFQKAADNLKKEVAAHPQNGEAWLMLGDIYNGQGKFVDMSNAYEKALVATQPAMTKEEREKITIDRFNAWLTKYNEAQTDYSAHRLELASANIDTAAMLRPNYSENLFLRGLIYREVPNKEKETAAYNQYISLVQPEVDEGMKAGLALGMTTAQVEARLGKPTKSQVSDTAGGFLYYAPKNVSVFFTPGMRGGAPEVEGWTFFKTPPSDIEQQLSHPLRSAPYYSLAVDAYQEGEKNTQRYDDALKYFRLVEKLDTKQEAVGPIIADIYTRTKRTGEAKVSYEDAIRQSPSDPSLYINYGTFLVSQKDYDGAVQNFEKALTISKGKDKDKEETALFDLGAVYKNWGADLQNAAGDKATNAQTAAFSEKLKKSLSYFEEIRKIKKTPDFALESEIANLYEVLHNDAGLNQSVKILESLQSTEGGNAAYWDTMELAYAYLGKNDKAAAAHKRAEDLQKGK